MDYLDKSTAYPYCPGCTHGKIMDALGAAMERLRLDPRRTAVVTDIGCVGLADKYLKVHTFHGLHGRSIAYAEGIKRARPDLKVIVLIGDGGIGIGGNHFLHAARRDAGVTTIVFNNFNFGMTGGEHSVTTPQGGRTSTTPEGNPERGLDVAAVARAAGATFVARMSSFDGGLDEVLAEAIAHDGFAVVDVWEVCTAYYMRLNDFKKKQIDATIGPTGVLHRERRAPFEAHPQARPPARLPAAGRAGPFDDPIGAEFGHSLRGRFGLVVAGSAGMRVRSAVRALGRAAVRCGLWASQKDDYPITVMTGHSVSDLVLSPEPIDDLRVESPDVLIVLSEDGLARIGAMPSRAGRVYAAEGLRVPVPAVTIPADGPRERRARAAVELLVRETGLVPPEALG